MLELQANSVHLLPEARDALPSLIDAPQQDWRMASRGLRRFHLMFIKLRFSCRSFDSLVFNYFLIRMIAEKSCLPALAKTPHRTKLASIVFAILKSGVAVGPSNRASTTLHTASLKADVDLA